MQDIAAYADYINDCIPEIGAASLRPFAMGGDWIVAELDNERLVRFPRDACATEVFAKEVSILDGLQRVRLPIHTPIILQRWYGDRTRSMPFVVMTRVDGTPVHKLRGFSANPAFTQSLAAMLGELHGFAVARLAHGEFDVRSKSQWCSLGYSLFIELLDSIAELLRPSVEVAVREAIVRVFNFAAQSPSQGVLLHGDLTYDNILVDPINGNVTGVIDFGDAQIGDPAFDFRTLVECFGEEASSKVYSQYASLRDERDDTFWQRTHLYAQLKPLETLIGSAKAPLESVRADLTAKWRRSDGGDAGLAQLNPLR